MAGQAVADPLSVRDVVARVEAMDGGVPVDPEVGFSGTKVLSLLTELGRTATAPGVAYAEIGVYRGLSLTTVASSTSSRCVGIDNFSLFNPDGQNRRIVEDAVQERGLDNIQLIDDDFEAALEHFADHVPDHRIGLLFVDGPHDYRSQLVALLKVLPLLAQGGVIVVDDANYPHVRRASRDFLATHPEFALVMEAFTPAHPAKMTAEQERAATAGWWNGIHVICHDPANRLGRRLPDAGDKRLFEQSHDVFRHRLSEVAFPIMQAVDRLPDEDADGRARTLDELLALAAAERQRHPDRFDHQNTHSRDLPPFWLADPAR